MNFPDMRIIYITRDIERALGMLPNATYHIVTNKTPYSEKIWQLYPEFVTLISSFDGQPLGTSGLMEHPEIATAVPHGSTVMVFKSTSRIESIAEAKGWKLINPAAALSEKIENKITQVEWLGDLSATYLPPHSIQLAKDLDWTGGEPFILQWAHGHTGDGTILIQTEAELNTLKTKFPERLTRRTLFIRGSSFTVNAVVAGETILMGNLSYQITGMEPFTTSPFTTIGNDWSLPFSLLDESEIAYIESMIGDIGKKLASSGWRGLFGVDIMRDDERNRIHLIEINARQPASTTFESFLQQENRIQGVQGITMFEAHLIALLNEPIQEVPIPINDGAQVIQRITKKIQNVSLEMLQKLETAGYTCISYPNTDNNADLIRIQSPRGIMEGHAKFNERGVEIRDTLSNI